MESFLHTIYIAFGKIVTVAILLPIIVALWKRKHLNKALIIFAIYRFLALLFNILEQVFYYIAVQYYESLKPWLDYWQIEDTSFLTILYQLNNFAFLGWFYFLLLPTKYGIWVKRLAIILFIAALINYLFIEGYQGFGVFNPNATALFTAGIALFYLGYLYRSTLALPLKKNPYFWMSLGLIIPYVIGLFLYFVQDETHQDNYSFFLIMSILKNVFLIVGQICMAIGFWYAQNTKYISKPISE